MATEYSSVSAVENRLDPSQKAVYDSVLRSAMGLVTGASPIYDEEGNFTGFGPAPEGYSAFSPDAYMRNIAPLTGLETAGYEAAARGIGQFMPYLQDARNLYGEQAGLTRSVLPYIKEGILSSRYGQDLLQDSLDPNAFTEQVADNLTARLEDREARQLAALDRQAAGAGALGGSRFGLERANIQDDTSRALTEGLGNLYYSEFDNFRNRQGNVGQQYANIGTGIANIGSTYGNLGTLLGTTASNMATLGANAQDLYGQDVGTAIGYGENLRGYNQNLLDTAQQNIYAEQSRPFSELGFIQELGGMVTPGLYGMPTPFPVGTSSAAKAATGIAGFNPFGGGSV